MIIRLLVLLTVFCMATSGCTKNVESCKMEGGQEHIGTCQADNLPKPPKGFVSLFNGKDLTGWEQVGGEAGGWQVADGVLFNEGHDGGWLSTTKEYSDFKLELEFMVPPGGNSGVFVRAPRDGNPAFEGSEIQVLDDYADQYKDLKPYQFCGSVYAVQAPSQRVSKPANEWQIMVIECVGSIIKVVLNDTQIIDVDLNDHMDKLDGHPGLKRTSGYIGFQHHGENGLQYRNIRIKEIAK